MRKFLLLLCTVLVLSATVTSVTMAYEGDPQWSDCDLCERYFVIYACWNCYQLWYWESGCFPGDPDCY